MIRHLIAASAALMLHSVAFAGELPKQRMQVVKAEDAREAVFLKQGDILQIVLPNNSGNFAEDVEISLGKAPLKLTRSVMLEYGTDTGQFAVGGGEIVYFFETTKTGNGDLEVIVKHMFDRGEKPFKLRVNVAPPSTAAR